MNVQLCLLFFGNFACGCNCLFLRGKCTRRSRGTSFSNTPPFWAGNYMLSFFWHISLFPEQSIFTEKLQIKVSSITGVHFYLPRLSERFGIVTVSSRRNRLIERLESHDRFCAHSRRLKCPICVDLRVIFHCRPKASHAPTLSPYKHRSFQKSVFDSMGCSDHFRLFRC